jgi:GT2 family glycosyltransferase
MESLTAIIIPTTGKLFYLKQTIESVLTHTENYKLIIINDSYDFDSLKTNLKELLNSFSQEKKQSIYIINNEKPNKGFASSVNLGFETSMNLGEPCRFVCILNDDVIVTPNWLEGMKKYFKSIKNLGIVGPTSNYASCWQLDDNYLDGCNVEKLNDYARLIAFQNMGRIRLSPKISGTCMLMTSHVANCAKFDEQYGLGFYEDDDFSYDLYRKGFINIIAEDVFIYHYGSSTFQRIPYKAKELLTKNFVIFTNKWIETPIELWDRVYREVLV